MIITYPVEYDALPKIKIEEVGSSLIQSLLREHADIDIVFTYQERPGHLCWGFLSADQSSVICPDDRDYISVKEDEELLHVTHYGIVR